MTDLSKSFDAAPQSAAMQRKMKGGRTMNGWQCFSNGNAADGSHLRKPILDKV